MKTSVLPKQTVSQIKQISSSIHGRIVLSGILLACCYLPTWGKISLTGMLNGHSDLFLQMGFVYLAGQTLWQNRTTIQTLKAQSAERLVGYMLLGCTIVMIPIVLSSSSLQAFLIMLLLSSLALSTWGITFFQLYPKAYIMLMMCIYPDWTFLADAIWDTTTPPEMLERFTAWLGSLGLQLMRYPAVATATNIRLPEGSVNVGSGCSGFDMALTLGIGGFILGQFLQLNRRSICAIMGIGVILALIANIPRVMLLAIASIHWGKASFDFWHGPIGGQLFSSVMFTIYYYIVMAIAKPPETFVK
jgi:exosortase